MICQNQWRRSPKDPPRFVEPKGRGSRLGRPIRLSDAALQLIAEVPWPGNARQLEDLLERAIGFTRSSEIRREIIADLRAELTQSLDRIRARHAGEERERLLQALHRTGGNISQTAELLEKSRSAVYRMIEKHGIPLRKDH